MDHRSLKIDWARNSGYAIVEPKLGMIKFLEKLMCPIWCAYITGHVYGDGCFKGFRVTSAGFEGCQADEENALYVARTCILAFLRPRISDFKAFANPEVAFRMQCAVLGLENLWLELVPFTFHRWHRSDAECTERDDCALSHWTADRVGEWVACAASGGGATGGAASDVLHVDCIEICAPSAYDMYLSGICSELEATLCSKMHLKFYRRMKCASMTINCDILGWHPDVDQNVVCNAIRTVVDSRIPTPHSHAFDFHFCQPYVASGLSPEAAAAAAEEDRLEAKAEEAIRESRREKHRQRRTAARAAAAATT